jgi:hypothetical protein
VASDLGDHTLASSAPSRPDIFLSYAREDQTRARDLAAALEQRGLTVFWDREVPPGQTWPSSIGAALANARCVVVAWSRHSVASQWVPEEASEGKDRNVLVPVLFETVPLPFGFRAIQAANLIDWQPGRASPAFDDLLEAVQRIVGGEAGLGMGPAVSDQPRSLPPRRQSSAWSRRTVLAMAVGLFAIAGGGGATLFWWLTQTDGGTPKPDLTSRAASPDGSSETSGAPSQQISKGSDSTAAPPAPVGSGKHATRVPGIVATIKRFDDQGGLLTLEMELFNESTAPPRSDAFFTLWNTQVIDERSRTSWTATHAGGDLLPVQLGGGQRTTVWAKFDLGPSRPEFLTFTADFLEGPWENLRPHWGAAASK